MTREELEMRVLVRESDVIDRTDGSELAKAFNTLWEKYVEQEPCEDAISRQAVEDKITTLINELEMIFSDIREKNVDDSVCGLCEYDCDHGIDGFANECPGFEKDDCFRLKDEIRKEWMELPSVQPKQTTGKCSTCKHYTPGEYDGSCGSYICKNYSAWEG